MTFALASPPRAAKVWRWVLLCALTTYSTLFVILSYENPHRIRIDYAVDPPWPAFIGIAYLLSFFLLFLGAPVVFRYSPTLASVAWLVLFASVVFSFL